MALTIERRVIASGRSGEMRQLRRQLYKDHFTGHREGDRCGLILLHPSPTLLYMDDAGVALTADVASFDQS